LIEGRHKLDIPLDPDIELDLKRLCYRFNIQDERVAILTAIHVISNMKMADFMQFITAYARLVKEMSGRKYPTRIYPNRIDGMGGLTLLKTLANLGYTLYEVEQETGLRTDEVERYLKVRGLKWSDLRFI